MHWSNNCSNPFSYGYNSSLESNCFDCPNYNPSFSKHYFCQQGYNINNNNSKLSPVVSPVNSSLITSKYNENINNRFSNFQTLTPSLLPTNQIKMRTDIDSQGKDPAEVSWGIMLPMQVSSNNNNLNKKLQWSYDLTNINNNKWDWNPCLDREKCVSSDTFKSLYSPNEFMLMTTQSSLKSDMSDNNRYTTSASASKGILRNNIKSNSQIKLINNNGINNSGESLLPYSNLTTGKGMNNNFNIETLQQTLSSVSFSDDNNPPSFTTSNNSAPSPSKKTWALIVGKHEKPSNLTYSNFSLRTNNVKRELNGPMSNIKAKTIMNTDVTVSNEINNKINMNDFDCNLKNAKFFVIKSYSEDDVYRSIKYQIWCSTETGNRRLDNAYSNCCVGNAGNGLGAEVPIYLFFSVNGSGHFCGVAKMVSSVDYKTRASVWAQGKWKGQFRVKWIFVKDVPNTQLRHIRIETNENKPVTNSRDVTEIPFEKGRQVLKIIANFKASSSIYDDFDHYEQRELLELNQ